MFIFSFLKLGFDFIAGRAIALFNMRMQIATFIVERWRVLIIASILALGAIHYLSLRNQYHIANAGKLIAQKALINHVEADSAAAKKREAENKLNAILAQKKTDASAAQHQSELSLIVAKGKADEIISHRDISNMRSKLRHTIKGYQTAGLLENDTNRFAERNGDPALFRQLQEELAVCKEAGAIAASDYNFCKSYVDIQQSVIGVQND